MLDGWSRIIYATLYAAHSNGKTPKLPPPVEIDHPGRRIERSKPKVERDPDQIKRFFQRF